MSLACKNNICVGKISTGNITREDILEAKLFSKDDFLFAAIFCFNLKILPDIEQYAKSQGIQIFSSNVVYKLFEDYAHWSKEISEKKKSEDLKDIKYHVKLEIFKDCIFRKCKPAIFGVKVLEGILKPGIKVIWQGKDIGTIKQIQINGKAVGEAKKDAEVAVSSDDISFEKDIDLNASALLYIYIPVSQREIVKKYLTQEYPDLIDEIFNIYEKNEL